MQWSIPVKGVSLTLRWPETPPKRQSIHTALAIVDPPSGFRVHVANDEPFLVDADETF